MSASALVRREKNTRTAVLDFAEKIFAEKGFAAARLEDVAEAVGIRRASIVYYFRDKRALYEAVLERLFGGLEARFHEVIDAAEPPGSQIETAILAWVDHIAEHPAFARLLLREIADSSDTDPEPAIVRHARPLLAQIDTVVRRGQEAGEFQPIDPIHLASTIGGATAFFIAATPLLGRHWPHDPLSTEQLDAHRSEVLRITRRLLGTTGPRPGRRRKKR